MMAEVYIKQEVIDDDDDVDTVACSVCSKTFASNVALNNHTRMEHLDLYLNGDPAAWTTHLIPQEEEKVQKRTIQAKVTKVITPKVASKSQTPSAEAEKLIKIKTEKLVSSMEPTSLNTLASENVSYIIIKANPNDIVSTSPIKKKKQDKEKPAEKKEPQKKVIQAITGPFECLQPSSLVPDKTCHQIFFSCCQYSVHYRDEHTRRRKGLRCQVCEKPLPNCTADDGMLYSCDLCGARFMECEELESHLSVSHVKEKPYECSVCHKKFTQKGGVQQHMRMHTGDKPYPCSFCPKSFTQKSGRDQHLRIHTKAKPYRCVICSKAFVQSIHLKQHMRTHTNVSPFQCGICQKRFKQSSHLNYHLRYHDPATLTDEQRQKYAELIGLIGTQLNRNGNMEQETLEATEVLEEQELIESQEVVVGDVHDNQYVVYMDDNEWSEQ